MAPYNLTVIIPTFNSEKHLEECLESVKWADEILICDSFSTDNTLEIAGKYTQNIVQHEYINSAKQKNWIIPQASLEWVLIIDSDEILEDELQHEIQQTLESPPDKINGYRIPRKNLVFGVWLRSCNMYPDYNIRLFRRDKGRYEDKEVHANVVIQGETGTLTHSFIHYDFEDVVQTIRKWARYTRYEGDQLIKIGRHFHWYDISLRPILLFFYYYFFTGAILDGFRGFFMASMWSFYIFLKYARLWQLEGTPEQ